MGKYLKKFNTHEEYESYIEGENIILPNVSICDDNKSDINHVHYNPYKRPILPLEFIANEDSEIYYEALDIDSDFEYSLDGINWNIWEKSGDLSNWTTETILLNAGEHLYIRGNNPNGLATEFHGGGFQIDGDITVKGELQSLINYENELTEIPEYCFAGLFSGIDITDASELIIPNRTGIYSYYGLFSSSTLIYAPTILPAMELSEGCYQEMFYECNQLITSPKLPAIILTNECYSYMFAYSEQLNNIECYAEDISAENCLENWVNYVASEGTFKCVFGMEDVFTRGKDGIPVDWVVTN